jgi:Protein of unknown function (DUF1553)/Protein of unknown function (DUF1549)/Planctomycete cytochrome C
MDFTRLHRLRNGLTGLAFLSFATATCAGPRVDFNREVRPLLSDTCFACHGPDAGKVKGGLRLDRREDALRPAKSGHIAIVPGKPDESELVRRLSTTDPDDAMPPAESHKTLTEVQKSMLRRWITEGAEYRGHWAYQIPERPVAPAGPAGIDFLVQRPLQGTGVSPAPEADRRTLLRRLHLDLTGLPPSPVEVAAFEQDASPDAYERRVDRLLASPRYGERMAIGWLDVVRFADTIGYHSDTPRNVWPYRDYVIRSFNRNTPFDRFTREQLAGDLLPAPSQEQLVASGFNRLLLTTEEGGAQAKDYEARYLTDRVRAVGSIWLGQTIGCAQCHDHKFDPITARDFYSMGAFFADVSEAIVGAREPGMLIPNEDQAPTLARHEAAVNALQREFEGPHAELTEAFQSWQREQIESLDGDAGWTTWAPAAATASEGTTLTVREDRSVLASGKKPERDTYQLRFTNQWSALAGLQIEGLPDDSLPSKGPGRAGNGNFVLTEVLAHIEPAAGESRPLRFTESRASIEQTLHVEKNPYGRWSAASAIDADVRGESAGWAILPETGRQHSLRLGLDGASKLSTGDTLVVELRQRHGDHHTLGRFRIAVATNASAVTAPIRRPPPAEIVTILRVPPGDREESQRDKLFRHYREQAPELAALREQLATARKARADFEATVARSLVTVRADPPRTVRILPRGNWMIETGTEVAPALPGYLAPVRGDADHRLSRLDLADWIVSPGNPLTTRVVVNRFWRQFFGMGLSKVIDDFGAQGEAPPNQELLDWLACEFRDGGWDVKHLVRLMVLSATYRQDSRASRELLARDPENRLLARQGRWRIEAELVRDTALTVSGLLVPQIGGPSAKPYQPAGYWENLNFPVRNYDASADAGQYRRGLYTWWQRSYVHPSFLAFDAPTREECAAERSRSNIPQQALVLLNDPSYVEAARTFAARILTEAPDSDDGRLSWAWRQMVARNPTPEELATTRDLLEKHRGEFRADPGAAARLLKIGASPAPPGLDPATLAAWTNVARALLNLHETITRS